MVNKYRDDWNFFFYIGHILYLHYKNIIISLESVFKKIYIYILVLIILIFSYIGFQNGKINMRLGEYGNNFILFILVASVITIVYLLLFNWLLYKKTNSLLMKEVETIGKNSIIYLGLNEIVINLIASVTSKINIYGFNYRIICIILCIFLIRFIIIILKSNKRFSNLLQIK